MKSIKELKGTLPTDIYVLGSGPSLNYLTPKFFVNKITVGVNHIYKQFPCSYVVLHHGEHAQAVIDSGNELVISETRLCIPGELMTFDGEYYQYKHKPQGFANIDYSLLDSDDGLVVGETTIINAISFAYFLGAVNIILCGVDCGTINHNLHVRGYYPDNLPTMPRIRSNAMSPSPRIEEFANVLRKRGVGVCSINPFINFSLEGNIYERKSATGNYNL